MGTETLKSTIFQVDRFFQAVKLNNPLMGTETSTIINGEYIANLFKVKLNNPLMGTETGLPLI